MQIIGAGLGRTGTSSLTEALGILGFSPCLHMVNIIKDPSLARTWTKALHDNRTGSGEVDWKEVMKGFNSGVDAPVCDVYKELAEAFPQAKVILTYREPKSWIKSCEDTIMRAGGKVWAFTTYWIPNLYYQRLMLEEMMSAYPARYGTTTLAESMMEARCEEVKKTIAPERLLVYQVQEGWGPLCKFLDVPVPDVPFPRVNDTETFKKKLLFAMVIGSTAWLTLAGGVAAAVISGVKYSRR